MNIPVNMPKCQDPKVDRNFSFEKVNVHHMIPAVGASAITLYGKDGR